MEDIQSEQIKWNHEKQGKQTWSFQEGHNLYLFIYLLCVRGACGPQVCIAKGRCMRVEAGGMKYLPQSPSRFCMCVRTHVCAPMCAR